MSILDADIEEVILNMLQQYADVLVDSRTVIDVQGAKNKERLAAAEKHLNDMKRTMALLQQDLRASYEAYKTDVTDKDTYLEQKKMYEQMRGKCRRILRNSRWR